MNTRRDLLKAAGLAALSPLVARAQDAKAKVVVWDERQPAQKAAYPNFLGNAIADHLRNEGGFDVASVALDDPHQGLPDELLESARVLIWWGHVRHGEVKTELARKIVARIKAGTLSLISVHSGHWSKPFVEAMNERSRLDVKKRFAGETIEIKEFPAPGGLPRYDSRLTPYAVEKRFPDGGGVKVDLHLPMCVFPSVRADGKPSHVRVTAPDHPINKGLPATFLIPQTEMYGEPFHVPEPDVVLLEERWESGDWFRAGLLWTLGKGHVVYFRPGHETYPVFRQAEPLKFLANAAKWMATQGA